MTLRADRKLLSGNAASSGSCCGTTLGNLDVARLGDTCTQESGRGHCWRASHCYRQRCTLPAAHLRHEPWPVARDASVAPVHLRGVAGDAVRLVQQAAPRRRRGRHGLRRRWRQCGHLCVHRAAPERQRDRENQPHITPGLGHADGPGHLRAPCCACSPRRTRSRQTQHRPAKGRHVLRQRKARAAGSLRSLGPSCRR